MPSPTTSWPMPGSRSAPLTTAMGAATEDHTAARERLTRARWRASRVRDRRLEPHFVGANWSAAWPYGVEVPLQGSGQWRRRCCR